MSHRIWKTLLVGLSVAGGMFAGTANADEPPCPGVIAESDALEIARKLAGSRITQFGGSDIRTDWNDAVWSVMIKETGGPYWFIVNVRADGRVIDCYLDVECEPDPGLDVPACKVTAGELIGKSDAARIATDYVKRGSLAPMPMRADSAVWYGAHWRVWFVPQGPAPVDSDFVVYVSPDGSEAELTYALVGPSAESFLFQEPVQD
jgi:hypothetical protein